MAQFLRTNPPPGDLHTMKLTAPSGGVYSGDWIKVGGVVGQVFEDAAAGEEFVLVYIAEKTMGVKPAGVGYAFVKTDTVFWDPFNSIISPTQTAGFYRIGVCTEDAAADVFEVEMDLHGILPAVEI